VNAAWSLRIGFLAVLVVGAARTQTPGPAEAPKGRWYKGNLHTHTLNSDGDSTPHEVATWYREHEYQFLVLSDHNYLTDVAGLNAIHAANEKFLLIPGEEVTDSFDKKPIHINAYNPERQMNPQHGVGVAATIQKDVDAIRAARALPSVNHPNFHWAISAQDLLKIKGLGLFEIYNGHPLVNNVGGGGFQSLDEFWDVLLTAGQRLHGIAVDDAHHFKTIGKDFSNPGRGWIQVRAEALTAAAIIEAIEKGDFYASSGVNLSDVHATRDEYRIEIQPRQTEKFTTYFIGESGRVLAKSFDVAPAYRFAGSEKYVRARVESSFGSFAWTQPIFPR
jgi:hypothetical protein